MGNRIKLKQLDGGLPNQMLITDGSGNIITTGFAAPGSPIRVGNATGTDTYAVTVAPAIIAYSTDIVYYIKFANSNTGASTLNVSSVGAVAIKKADGAVLVPLDAGDIKTTIIYQLVYDGVQFQITIASNTIGPAEDGVYTDGLFTDFVPSTPIGTPIDRFNEILKSLVPPPAPILSDYNAVKSGIQASGKLSFDTANPIAAASYIGADTSFVPVNVDQLWTPSAPHSVLLAVRLGIVSSASGNITGTLNYQVPIGIGSPNAPYPATAFSDADKGLLKLYINGIQVTNIDLVATPGAFDSTIGNTVSGLNISAKNTALFPQGDPFTFFYNRTGTFLIKDTDANLVQGYNYIHVRHIDGANFDRILSRVEFVVDDATILTAYTLQVLDNLIMTGSKKLSGIDYHTSGTAEYDVTINNAYRNTYSTAVDAVSFIGNANAYGTLISAPAQALTPSFGIETQAIAVVNKLATITPTNVRIINSALSLSTSVKRTVQTIVAGGLASVGTVLVDNIISTNNLSFEAFDDETYRLTTNSNYDTIGSISTNPWDSTQSLFDGSVGHITGLQVVNGELLYPSSTGGSIDFSTTTVTKGSTFNNGGIGGSTRDYTALTGTRTYYRYFQQVSPTTGNFVLNIAGVTGTFVDIGTALTGNNIHVEIKAPSRSGWLDAYKDFATGMFANGNGARNSGTGAGRAFSTNWGITIGTLSTANTGGYIVIRITVGASFVGKLDSLTWTFS